jgi:serine/threonine-protein kinase
MWSESFDGDLKNVFELQERIARAITAKLKVVLQGEQAPLAQKGTSVPEAHQQYLRGRYFLMRRGFTNLRNAEAAFKAASTADANYADAWAGLAQAYALLPEYSTFDPDAHGRFVDTVPQALEAAARALALDPTSARALSARAYVKTGTLFDWDGAEADYRAAIASDPHDATARQWYAEMLMYQRRYDEALKSYDAAVEIEPLGPIMYFSRGLARWMKGDLEGSLADFDEGHRIAPELFNLNFNRLLVLVDARRFDQARAAVADMPRERQDFFSAFVAAVQDGTGRERVVQEVVSTEIAGITGTPVMLMMLGEREKALAMLERQFAARDPLREFVYTHRVFEPLRSDPRFQALGKQIGLPKAPRGATPGP